MQMLHCHFSHRGEVPGAGRAETEMGVVSRLQGVNKGALKRDSRKIFHAATICLEDCDLALGRYISLEPTGLCMFLGQFFIDSEQLPSIPWSEARR